MADLYFGNIGTAEENQLKEILDQFELQGFVYAIYSDHVECKEYDGFLDISKLLEFRVFNEEKEFKAIRTSLGKSFCWRVITKSEELESCPEFYIEMEEQYLDIDQRHSNISDGKYVTTGGGQYTLPVVNAQKITIENYYIYDDEGVAHWKDFRIVKIEGGKMRWR